MEEPFKTKASLKDDQHCLIDWFCSVLAQPRQFSTEARERKLMRTTHYYRGVVAPWLFESQPSVDLFRVTLRWTNCQRSHVYQTIPLLRVWEGECVVVLSLYLEGEAFKHCPPRLIGYTTARVRLAVFPTDLLFKSLHNVFCFRWPLYYVFCELLLPCCSQL